MKFMYNSGSIVSNFHKCVYLDAAKVVHGIVDHMATVVNEHKPFIAQCVKKYI